MRARVIPEKNRRKSRTGLALRCYRHRRVAREVHTPGSQLGGAVPTPRPARTLEPRPVDHAPAGDGWNSGAEELAPGGPRVHSREQVRPGLSHRPYPAPSVVARRRSALVGRMDAVTGRPGERPGHPATRLADQARSAATAMRSAVPGRCGGTRAAGRCLSPEPTAAPHCLGFTVRIDGTFPASTRIPENLEPAGRSSHP